MKLKSKLAEALLEKQYAQAPDWEHEGADGKIYSIRKAVGGEYIVLVNGFQKGGRIDSSGAGDKIFPDFDAAREFVDELEGEQ